MLLVVNEDVAWSDISDISPMRLEISLRCNKRIEQIPKICLLEILFFWFPPCYLIAKIDREVWVCILHDVYLTKAVPVVLHISLSGVKPVCSGRNRNSGSSFGCDPMTAFFH